MIFWVFNYLSLFVCITVDFVTEKDELFAFVSATASFIIGISYIISVPACRVDFSEAYSGVLGIHPYVDKCDIFLTGSQRDGVGC